jgi:glycosyltransferase involved in cell wall biosynthesis
MVTINPGRHKVSVKRVLIVYHYIAHYRKPVFLELCRSADIHYTIAACEDCNEPALKVLRCESAGVEISERWIALNNHWLFGRVLWQEGLMSVLRSTKWDAVILLGNVYFVSTWVAALLLRVRGVKVLMWTQGMLEYEWGVKGAIRRMFYGLADDMLLYGQRAKNFLINGGFDADHLHVVFNSLDYIAQANVRRELLLKSVRERRLDANLPIEGDVVVGIGRMTKIKRFDQLLQAFAILGSSNKDLYLVLIGDGPDLQLLKRMAGDLGIADRVEFRGACYEEADIGRTLSAASLFVNPGDTGLSCVHAMTYGVPVVTHDNMNRHGPEVEAVVAGVTGDFFAENSITELAELVQTWLVRLMDDSKRRHIASECMKVIDEGYTPAYQRKVINSAVHAALAR